MEGSSISSNAHIINNLTGTLVRNGANIYLTDSIKLYTDPKENDRDARIFTRILLKEIEMVKPDCIIYFQSVSDSLTVLLNTNNIYAMKHPNARKFSNGKDKYYKDQLKKIDASLAPDAGV